MSKEKLRVPKLRFPGFTEDWEQRKLSEVVIINPKTELPNEFKYVDLESVVGTNLLGFQVIKKENAPSRAQRLASYGDVFYQTVRPYQRNNYLFEDVDKDMVFSTGYAQLRSKLDSYFLLTLVQNDNFVKVVLDNCTGTSYPAINGSELGKINVQIPSNEVEANQIGKVFRGIDKNITLHQRKLEHLNLKKKALLQKLFPKNGERYPELRFPGFTDAWEQRKLIYIFNDFVVPMRDKPKVFSGTTPWTRIEDIEGRYINTSLSGQFVSDETIKSMNLKVIPKGSLIVSASATFGVVAIVNNDLITNQTFIGLVPNKDFDIDFLYSLFEAPTTKGKLLKLSAGSTIFYIARESFENLVLSVPSKEEQIKISKVFKSIDDSITLHQRKLEHLQLQKKALLQQMFV